VEIALRGAARVVLLSGDGGYASTRRGLSNTVGVEGRVR
jgi:hypothetical protein